jgi:hypothetical protein
VRFFLLPLPPAFFGALADFLEGVLAMMIGGGLEVERTRVVAKPLMHLNDYRVSGRSQIRPSPRQIMTPCHASRPGARLKTITQHNKVQTQLDQHHH